MRTILVRLIIEDTCNPSDDEAIRYVEEMICEIFGKEERKEHPRCKLGFIEIKHAPMIWTKYE